MSIGFPILLLALWELAVDLKWLDERFFPAPHAVAAALYQLTVQGELMGKLWLLPGMIAAGDWAGMRTVIEEGHVWISLFRTFSGFFIGAIPGISAAVIDWISYGHALKTEKNAHVFFVRNGQPPLLLVLQRGDDGKTRVELQGVSAEQLAAETAQTKPAAARLTT